MCDVVESRWRDALFGKHFLRSTQPKRTGVLETSLGAPKRVRGSGKPRSASNAACRDPGKAQLRALSHRPTMAELYPASRDGPVVLVNIAYLRSGRRTLPSMVVLNTTVPHAIAWVVSVGTLLLALAVVEAVAAVAATDSPVREFGSAAAVLP
jgi:hypothetical protein